MERVVIKSLAVVNQSVFPPLEFLKNGVSMHKNVLIVWDKDYDPRVIKVIDHIKSKVGHSFGDNCQLVAISEAKGGVSLLWDGYVPGIFTDESESIEVAGDCFAIIFSKSI